jgi:hypothetical protein
VGEGEFEVGFDFNTSCVETVSDELIAGGGSPGVCAGNAADRGCAPGYQFGCENPLDFRILSSHNLNLADRMFVDLPRIGRSNHPRVFGF